MFNNGSSISRANIKRIACILKDNTHPDYQQIIEALLAIPESNQFQMAKALLIEDKFAFSAYISAVTESLGGKHLFDDNQCAYFLNMIFHIRNYLEAKDVNVIDLCITKIIDGYTGSCRIINSRAHGGLPNSIVSYNLSLIDDSIARYISRLVDNDPSELWDHSFKSIFVDYYLPKSLTTWLKGYKESLKANGQALIPLRDMIEIIISTESMDREYMTSCVQALGLNKTVEIIFSFVDKRSISNEIKLLCSLYGEENVFTKALENKWQYLIYSHQATSTLSVLKSSATDWSMMPRLLSFAVKNLHIYYHDMMGHDPDETFISSAILQGHGHELAEAILMSRINPLLGATDKKDVSMARLLEELIADASVTGSSLLRESLKERLRIIGRGLSCTGAENMPDYINDISSSSRSMLFSVLDLANTDRRKMFERFPDVGRAALSAELGL